jgi:predicted nucleotide-binding protein
MPPALYKVGELSSTGQKIAEILGQSPHACVYTTADNQLRWAYYENKGVLSDRLQQTVARFDTLMSAIKSLPEPAEAKRDIYVLLGKSLFTALSSKRPKPLSASFKEVEKLIASRNAKVPVARIRRASRRVFVVHGHDAGSREAVARFLERLALQAIILKDQASAGQTIIEKFETESDVGFAVVLLTPDDVGATGKAPRKLRARARQNVVFELGYFSGTLGRGRVAALVKGDVEIPSDYKGVAFINLDEDDGWKIKLANELKAAGLSIDLNKAVG